MAGKKGRSGGARKNSGPKPSLIQELRAAAVIAVNWTGDTPAQFLQRIMQDETQDPSYRMEAAKACIPLVHQKQPEASQVEVSTTVTKRIILDASPS